MKSNEIFPGKYLRAADLGNNEPVVTIRGVEMEKIGNDRKPIVYFEGKERGVVLNKTNFTSIVTITGEEDSDNWKGYRIKLIVAKVEFQGARVPAIRIEAPPKNGSRPAPPPPPVDPPSDDDIPFAWLLPLALPLLSLWGLA